VISLVDAVPRDKVALAATALEAVKIASPTVVDPRFCLAFAIFVAPVPPEAIESVPAIFVKLTVEIFDAGIIPTKFSACKFVKIPPLEDARLESAADEG
jgi:hypothetical protein